jgi:hypothetical protein
MSRRSKSQREFQDVEMVVRALDDARALLNFYAQSSGGRHPATVLRNLFGVLDTTELIRAKKRLKEELLQ